ncbi:hypothetical protein FRC00_009617 [Tulasnella sp. 408]|nr:hypothetical protein FRC00_009617 [Tulasnella sp. 408]
MVHFLRGMYAPLLEEADITPPLNRTHDDYGEEIFFGWSEAADSAMRKPALAVPARSLKRRAGDAENGPPDKVRFVLFLMAIFPYITALEIEAPFLSISHICQAHAAAQRRGRPLLWTNIEKLTIRGHFDRDTEEQYEKVVEQLTESLRQLTESGVWNLRELKLSVNHSIHSCGQG